MCFLPFQTLGLNTTKGNGFMNLVLVVGAATSPHYKKVSYELRQARGTSASPYRTSPYRISEAEWALTGIDLSKLQHSYQDAADEAERQALRDSRVRVAADSSAHIPVGLLLDEFQIDEHVKDAAVRAFIKLITGGGNRIVAVVIDQELFGKYDATIAWRIALPSDVRWRRALPYRQIKDC
jgi:hypothetical protein